MKFDKTAEAIRRNFGAELALADAGANFHLGRTAVIVRMILPCPLIVML
jgi:hypothetical protein